LSKHSSRPSHPSCARRSSCLPVGRRFEETPFRAEARALAAILSSDAAANSPLAIGPDVRWFWDEVPAMPEWRRRIWRHDAEIKLSTPLIKEALRCSELKRPLIVQSTLGVFERAIKREGLKVSARTVERAGSKRVGARGVEIGDPRRARPRAGR
jgi:hypothetical protein